jgi:CheY-like chemotaxis protein
MKSNKEKKEKKWFTYVDSTFDKRVKKFMNQYNIKNQAKLIRDSVKSYIDSTQLILEKDIEAKDYNEKYVDDLIKKAINSFIVNSTLYEELKQKISPLRLSILMLSEFLNEPSKLLESIDNAKIAVNELENLIKQRFEDPELIRYIQKFDILYIEDNELERKTIETYFKRTGVNIQSVETSEEGFDLLKRSTPQVILLDINLKSSNIDGIKFCQILKSKKTFENIPIILISAIVSKKERKNILTATKAEHIIIKPIEKLADLNIVLKFLKNTKNKESI